MYAPPSSVARAAIDADPESDREVTDVPASVALPVADRVPVMEVDPAESEPPIVRA
jgi:hypothetical protein